MPEGTHKIELKTVNSPTILVRVIQVIKRKRIGIRSICAVVRTVNDEDGKIKIRLETDEENLRLLKLQLNRLIDVIDVK